MPGSLVRKLEQFTRLTEAEKQIIMAAPTRSRQVGAGQDIVADGSRPTDISLISDGFACRYKLLGDGRRQILAFVIPGDICDLRALLLRCMDYGVAALSPCRVSVIPHQKLFGMLEKHPRLNQGLWADTMLDGCDLSAMADQCWPSLGIRAHRSPTVRDVLAFARDRLSGQWVVSTASHANRHRRRDRAIDRSRQSNASRVARPRADHLALEHCCGARLGAAERGGRV